MIDIHCHILPGIDDGAGNEQISLSMAKEAVAEGITQIVATPHHRNRHWDNPKHSVLTMVKALNRLFEREKAGIEVLPGQEVRIFGEMAEDAADAELLSVNETGKYILVEFPTHHVPRYAQQLFYDLQVKGVTPVIVHPERNQEIFEHPDILYEFITDGALSQVTAASIAGKNGKKVRKRTLQFIEHNLTHFIASDAHNVTKRPFYMKKAFLEVKKRYGPEIVHTFKNNAKQLINGDHVSSEPPVEIKNKKFLGIF
ncbi:tyrosine protein phosphatase [Sporolactobacillus sp. THM7-4]|nr:tyrosine protein phosphatase [Sporolactobacillus sp. THM7-4]